MNLIICSLDTLRADHLSCLGNERGLTPNLDRIASEGALFTQTYATDIPTQPSDTALFTGEFGVHTGIVSAVVTQIEPAPVTVSGQTYFLVDLSTPKVAGSWSSKTWNRPQAHQGMARPGTAMTIASIRPSRRRPGRVKAHPCVGWRWPSRHRR